MARSEVINADPFCSVDIMPLEQAPQRGVIRLKDEHGDWQPLEGVSAIHNVDSYKLVANSRVYQLAQDVLTRSGFDFDVIPENEHSKANRLAWDGRKFSAKWIIPSVSGDVSDGGTRSKLHLGVEALNSYDGSYKVGIQFYMMNMACFNQFYSGHLLGGFVFGHYDRAGSDLDTDIQKATEMISGQAETFARALPRIQALSHTKLSNGKSSLERFLEINLDTLEDIWRPTWDSHILREIHHRGITQKMGRPQVAHSHNLWGLLNGYSAVATHVLGGFHGVGISRLVTDKFLEMAV